MLVKNLKCSVCGANKVNDISLMYIYCDYCGSWMGLDMSASVQESVNVFTPERMNDPNILEYNRLNGEILKAALSNNKSEYIKLQCSLHALEFELFPNRFGPKAKQSLYRSRYLDFYRNYYEEVVDENYFDRFKNPPKFESLPRLKYSFGNGKLVYEFNEDFKEYIDENIKFINDSFALTKNLKSVYLHPENSVADNPKLMYQISINAFIQAFSTENAEQIIDHLGLKSDYIEIPDVTLSILSCTLCSANLSVPANSEKVLCTVCGCTNKVKSAEIQCINCGAGFNPKDDKKCPYCGGIVESPKSMSDYLENLY